MLQILKDAVPLWQFSLLSPYSNIQHFVSGRAGGKSLGMLSELNLSYSVGDKAENVVHNRSQIAEAMDIPLKNLVFPGQTHSTNIQILSDRADIFDFDCTDALVTDIPNICIAVLAADCVPVLVYDPKKKVIAAIHSGWKGTVGKILTRTLNSMQDNFGSDYVDLLIGIGPSIGPEVYEVGEEVITAVEETFRDSADVLLRSSGKNGKAYFNLWEANRRQALAMGVPFKNIEVAQICTLSNSDTFFSARASKGGGGRFASGIMLLKS